MKLISFQDKYFNVDDISVIQDHPAVDGCTVYLKSGQEVFIEMPANVVVSRIGMFVGDFGLESL